MRGVFALPCGVDFPKALVEGLRARMAGQPPEAMAGVTLYLNTQRMRRRVTALLTESGAGYLPRLRLVTDLGADVLMAGVPAAVSGLRRRLELTQLVAGLLAKEPDLAPRAALYDLADSLAALMDEMQGEGVAPERVAAVNVEEHSAHWARTKAFLNIVVPFFQGSAPDAQARQRLVVARLVERWAVHPPKGPVIVAGSTGSRGTTALLMQAVAGLPQGALVLPGFDFDMPDAVWERMGDAMTAEDHPQFRFKRLMDGLGIGPHDVAEWHAATVPDAGRNKLVSLSLRPAPVTDQWLTEGAGLPDLLDATKDVTLIEAQTPRAEALAVALVLREAAENGVRAALISPDRMLTRQVTAALDRWGILPDDSAGRPLALTPPGRFLRHVVGLMGRKLTGDALLALLKHPLALSGDGRGLHLRLTRELELGLRKKGPAFPDGAFLRAWAAARKEEGAAGWGALIGGALDVLAGAGEAALAAHVALHRHVAETLGGVELWEKEAGKEALSLIHELQAEADAGGVLEVTDYRDLFESIVSRGEVRESVTPHPDVMIWGTLEARVGGAELVILGGLNDGIWPKLPEPDPWLNRKMRKEAGLLLPERQIGLSAHDYQQAIAAPRVVLTRATRNAEAETVPSRWVNRLMNLMQGLPERNGDKALAEMRARGRVWVRRAAVLEAPLAEVAPAHRPSPRPPVAVRPRRLAVTQIAKLIRDPYAVYARYILRLFALDPLRPEADAALRGQVLHLILEEFAETRVVGEARAEAKARLMRIAQAVLERETPWPAARALWLARLGRAAEFFLSFDAQRGGVPAQLEEKGRVKLPTMDFTLEGTPDRIDVLPDGRLHIIDYKTGTPPSQEAQKHFDKQLLLAAAMAERGGFKGLEGAEVALISYLGLGSKPSVVETEITPQVTGEVWEGLNQLIAHYFDESSGFTARRAVMKERFEGDYDHLSRYGEWETTDTPVAEDVGK